MKSGDRVRMSEALKTKLRGNCLPDKHVDSRGTEQTDDGCLYCSTEHVEEFGECEGTVEGATDYNVMGDSSYDPAKVGPEVDVRWQPSNLRYAYDPEDLELTAQ
jgi:hypothetical protein